jgi:diadenosine tetraphosphate (Ap4A) HIT family hydrolase
MRILFATYSEKTHFFSMVPLAWALRTAGHEVRVASQPEIIDTITSTGLTAVSVGKDHSVNRILTAFPRLQEKVADGRLDPFIRADEPEEDLPWEYVRDNYDSVVLSWFRLMNNPMLDDLVAFCPFASRLPLETWIVPRIGQSDFREANSPLLEKLALVTKRLVSQIEKATKFASYNFLIHTSPFDTTASEHYHWHLEILPRVTVCAGFEWGTGMYVNPVAPEEAARAIAHAE